MYMIRPRPVRSHQHSQLLQTEQFFQNGSLAWRYDQDDDDEHEHEYDSDSDSAPAYMDVGHFRWFWPWGVRRSSTFDTMPSGSQRLPVAALLAPSSITPQPSSLLLTRLPAELRLNIWRLVLQTRCSAVWTYDARSPAWRPDRRGAPYIDAALLRTCKAVYAETWDLPMRLTRAVLADGSPADKPGEWAGVVLAPGVLVPHAWQVLLLREAEVTMQHFRLEAGFLEAWVTALGKLKAAAATCVADLVRERREGGEGGGGGGGGVVNEEVVRVLGERQPLEEIVVRMNRMDWWTWTSTPPKPWPESLPGECVADVRGVGRRKSRATRRTRGEEEWEEQRERWIRKDDGEDGDGGDAPSGQQTDEETIEQDIQSHDRGIVLEDTTVTSELSYGHVDDPSSPQPYEDDDDEEDDDDDDDLGGYFSDHTASSTASSAVYVFDAATLPSSLHLAPLATGLWDRNPSYGVLSPHLRITLMLETFGPKSLQLDAALADAQTWRLPMPPVVHHHHNPGHGEEEEEEGGWVLAWDGRPVREYHWLRDVGGEEAEGAAFLRMPELKATAEGVVVKMMTLVPRSA
ncbi:hypothetical protein ARSEF1564_006823 [Beauveria bassiana]